MQYKGIELAGLDKEVRLAHSRFFDHNEGIDWLEKMFDIDKRDLTVEQFHEVSALSSVLNFNYQVCNGGISQYFFNGYDQYREPMDSQDVAQLDRQEQVKMLRRLAIFGHEVFPERDEANRVVARISNMLASVGEDDEQFDDLYYSIDRYVEFLCETYAQYICKAFGMA